MHAEPPGSNEDVGKCSLRPNWSCGQLVERKLYLIHDSLHRIICTGAHFTLLILSCHNEERLAHDTALIIAACSPLEVGGY
jgi:hypothetical protein